MDAVHPVLSDCAGPANAFFRMRPLVFLICLGLFFISSNGQAASTRSGQVTHVMLFWLKRPGNVNDQDLLLRGLRTLRRVRGMSEMRIGRAMPMDGSGSDRSFDLGAIAVFRDRQALEKFERDPRHRGALDAAVQSLVRRYIVYDFSNE
jgi:Stress responsive A/B Barrel Domain